MNAWKTYRKLEDITTWRKVDRNKYGESSFEDSIVVQGRWNDTPTRMDDPEGKEFVAMGVIYIGLEADVYPGDRIARGGRETWGEGTTFDKLCSFVVGAVKHSRNTRGTRHLKAIYLKKSGE